MKRELIIAATLFCFFIGFGVGMSLPAFGHPTTEDHAHEEQD